MLLSAIAVIPVLIWIYVLFGRGGFWRVSKNIASHIPQNVPRRRVVAVIPARNEAVTIGETITSLLEQHLPAPIHIVVVDDASTDRTAAAAQAAAASKSNSSQLAVLTGAPLRPGWTGKLWALSQGVAHAATLAPDYLLFTDADIRYQPGAIAALLATAEAGGYDLASYMVKLACSSFADKALIPAFVFFFLKLYPPARIRAEKSNTAGAAGGSILIRPEALERIGGLAAIRNQVIDDCALARAVKRSGGRIWMALTDQAESIRSYGSFAEIGRMISRTAFNQLRHSVVQLFAAVLGMCVTYLLPPLLLVSNRPVAMFLGASACLLMIVAYVPMLRFYRRSPAWALALPLIAAFYLAATIHSAVQYWRGRGSEWKGRFQDARGR